MKVDSRGTIISVEMSPEMREVYCNLLNVSVTFERTVGGYCKCTICYILYSNRSFCFEYIDGTGSTFEDAFWEAYSKYQLRELE